MSPDVDPAVSITLPRMAAFFSGPATLRDVLRDKGYSCGCWSWKRSLTSEGSYAGVCPMSTDSSTLGPFDETVVQEIAKNAVQNGYFVQKMQDSANGLAYDVSPPSESKRFHSSCAENSANRVCTSFSDHSRNTQPERRWTVPLMK